MAKKPKPGKPKAQGFVLDGSITLVWAFEDETDAYAETVADSLANVPATVPAVWPLEVANALLMGQQFPLNPFKYHSSAEGWRILGPIVRHDHF